MTIFGLVGIWILADCHNINQQLAETLSFVVNPRIQVMRARFSEITATSINRAINNLIPPDSLQNDAVDVRTELDLRIGNLYLSFTCWLSLIIQREHNPLS